MTGGGRVGELELVFIGLHFSDMLLNIIYILSVYL